MALLQVQMNLTHSKLMFKVLYKVIFGFGKYGMCACVCICEDFRGGGE